MPWEHRWDDCAQEQPKPADPDGSKLLTAVKEVHEMFGDQPNFKDDMSKFINKFIANQK